MISCEQLLLFEFYLYKFKKYWYNNINKYGINTLKIAIEYDGYYFHKNIKRDEEKSNLCSKNGWKLIRVREIGCPQIKTKDTMIQVTAGKEDDLKKAILQILQICNVQNTSFSNLFDDKFIYSKK